MSTHRQETRQAPGILCLLGSPKLSFSSVFSLYLSLGFTLVAKIKYEEDCHEIAHAQCK